MHLIEWDTTYELGIQKIDYHHKTLIELLNKAYSLLLYSTDKANIQTILQELIKYTEYHFDAEELLMKDVSYKGLIPHVIKHSGFKNQFDNLMQDYLSGAPNVYTDTVMFLCNWFTKHILKDDRKFTIYLSKSKNTSFTMPTAEN
jgi:hemerythrin